MNLKKGTIYNTPLNPLSRGEFWGSSFKRGVTKKILSQEGSFSPRAQSLSGHVYFLHLCHEEWKGNS